MKLHSSESIVRDLFAQAQIEINGSQPYDLQVNDERFYRRFLADGALGFGSGSGFGGQVSQAAYAVGNAGVPPGAGIG